MRFLTKPGTRWAIALAATTALGFLVGRTTAPGPGTPGAETSAAPVTRPPNARTTPRPSPDRSPARPTRSGVTAERTAMAEAAVHARPHPAKDFRNIAMTASLETLESSLDALLDLAEATDIDYLQRQLSFWPEGPRKEKAQIALVRRWTEVDPLAAMDYVANISGPRLRHDLNHEAVRAWARIEPFQALEYTEIDPTGDLPRARLRDVYRGAAQGEPENALLFLEQADAVSHQRYVSEALALMFGDNPDRIIAWTEGLPPGPLKNIAYDQTLDQWARYDPLAAKAWMERTVPEHHLQEAHMELAESWARVDPRAAIDWALGLPEDQQTRRVTDRVFSRWFQYGSADAAAWLGDQEPSPLLDGGIERYVNTLGRGDPENTMAWVESVHDDGLRNRLIERLARQWGRQDPEAMASYVVETDLPDDRKQRLLRSANR